MAKRGRADHLIKCEYCGELYSDSYSHCPFCNEDGTGRWDDIEKGLESGEEPEYTEQRGGRRLMRDDGGRRGPSVWTVVKAILSMGLIIAAICIVVVIVRSILTGGNPAETDAEAVQTPGITDAIDDLPPAGQPGAVVQPGTQTLPDGTVIPEDPSAVAPAVPDPGVPAPGTTPPPVAGQPTSFSLNRTDFTFQKRGEVFNMQVSFAPAGTKGEIQWKSSDPNVASVSWNGVVTAISDGTATLTATVVGVGEQTCIVRCKFGDSPAAPSTPSGSGDTAAPAASQAPAQSGGVSLNLTDFTMREKGEKVKLKVNGTSSSVVWSIADDSVATLAGDGTVTAVSKGMTKVTATVDGTKLTCIVRCSF